MAEFTPIETQEAFDSVVKERLERCKKTTTEELSKQYEGYISADEFANKTSEFTKQIDELTGKISDYDTKIANLTAENQTFQTNAMKVKIANEFKIPYELSNKLTGTTEDEIKADAETLSKFIAKPSTQPLFQSEPPAENSNQAAIRKTLAKLKNI